MLGLFTQSETAGQSGVKASKVLLLIQMFLNAEPQSPSQAVSRAVLLLLQTRASLLQIDPSDTESILTLTGLSSDDNGRKIVCSVENMVGQSEATLELNILCKGRTQAYVFRNYAYSFNLPNFRCDEVLNAVFSDHVFPVEAEGSSVCYR